MNQVPQTSGVAQLNDHFRKSFVDGTVVITTGIQALPEKRQQAILAQVQCFDVFTEDNDPYGEHDFGSFTSQGCLINWKLDCVPQKRKEKIHMN